MKKFLPIGIGILVLLGFILFTRKSPQSAQDTPKESSDSLSGNLKELITRNVPLKCTFDYQDETAGSTTGTVYISGDNMRGDFEMTQAEQKFTSSMIRDQGYVYTWSSAQPQGMKMKLEEPDTQMSQEEIPENFSQQLDIENESINYSCNPWSPDNSMFTPPANIEFTDLSEQMEKLQESTKEMLKDQCGTCDQLPEGDAQDQCREALGC